MIKNTNLCCRWRKTFDCTSQQCCLYSLANCDWNYCGYLIK